MHGHTRACFSGQPAVFPLMSLVFKERERSIRTFITFMIYGVSIPLSHDKTATQSVTMNRQPYY